MDQLLWALIVLAILVALRTGRTSSWLLAGVAAGVGLEQKHTVAVLLLGVLVGLVTTRRQVLAGAGPWVACLVAAAIWAPNLLWDARHGWVTLDMARTLADDQGGPAGALVQLPLLLFLLPGPLIAYLWMRGAAWTVSGAGRPHRWVLVAAGVVTVAVVVGGGKPYYPAPLLAPLFALGAVATEQRWDHGSVPRRRASTLVTWSAVVAPILSLAVLPPQVATALRPLDPEPMETYGWPGFAEQVVTQVRRHPGAVAVYAGNYGEAGALHTFGEGAGLDVPIVSGHNAYRDWGPPPGRPTTVVAVGQFDASYLRMSWRDVERLAPIRLPDGLEDQETEEGAAIYLCRRPKGTWAELWPNLSFLA